MQKSIDYAEAYLFIHGWRHDAHYRETWNHPNEPPKDRHPPPMTWTTEEAVDIQRLNDRFNLLDKEGWEIELGGMRAGYYVSIRKVRSSANGIWGSRRRILTLKTAFERQREKGWTFTVDDDPTLPALRHGSDIYAWCIYCDKWHQHGCGPERPSVGESAGHRTAHCNAPPLTGYHLCIGYVID